MDHSLRIVSIDVEDRCLDGPGNIGGVGGGTRLCRRSSETNLVVDNHVNGTAGAIATQLRHLQDRKSTRLNSSHVAISYAVFCLKKNTNRYKQDHLIRNHQL